MTEIKEVTVIDLWRVIIARAWTVAIVAMLTTTVSAAYAFMATPVYRASTLTSPIIETDAGSGLAGLTGQFGDIARLIGSGSLQGSGKAEAIATLRSRAFLASFIETRDLLPILFEGSWDSGTSQWLVEEDAPTMSDGYQLFSKQVLAINEDRATGLITLSIMWHDPDLAASWANDLILLANDLLRQRAIDEANRTIQFLYKELEATSVVDLEQLIFRLIEHQINKITLANARDQYAFKVIDPAMSPEADEFVSPQRLLTVILGILFGLIIGCIIAMFQNYQQQLRESGFANLGSESDRKR